LHTIARMGDADASAGAADTGAGASSALNDLAEIRKRHQEKFLEREAAAKVQEEELETKRLEEQRQQQEADQELAQQFAKEEEEGRLRQLEEDEAYSRQLMENAMPNAGQTMSYPGHTGSGANIPMQSFSGAAHTDVPLDDDTEYHQMEDEEEGYRRPMRTGYVDRLIDPIEPSFVNIPQFYTDEDLQIEALLRGEAGTREFGVGGMRMPRWKQMAVWAAVTVFCLVIMVWMAESSVFSGSHSVHRPWKNHSKHDATNHTKGFRNATHTLNSYGKHPVKDHAKQKE